MQKKQDGFSLVEAILIAVIVGLIAFVGWYVWNSKNKTNETLNSVDKTSGSATAGSKIPLGWTTYLNKDLGITFAYPKNWTFEDKSKTPTSTKSYYIGELTSDDKATTVAITLVRKKDGRNTHSSIDEWKTYAANSNIQYGNLTAEISKYTAFSYFLDMSGAKSLVYQVLGPENNIEMVVLPTGTDQKTTIQQIVNTLRFE